LLETPGIGAFPEAIVESFEADALVLELTLSDADKDDAIADRVLATHPSGDFVFALALLEMDDRDLMALNVVLNAAHVALGQLAQQGRGSDRELHFHGLFTLKLTLPAHETEAEDCFCPVPRSGT
jgi:hypothetical protein